MGGAREENECHPLCINPVVEAQMQTTGAAAVQELLVSVRGNPPRTPPAEPPSKGAEEEKEAYSKLMDHLDNIDMLTRHWRQYVRGALELVVFSGLVGFLVVSLSVEPTKHKRLLKLRIWQWATMALMVTAIFSVVPFATWLLSLPFRTAFRTSKYWVYYLRRMKRSVDYTLWSCLVLLGWYAWFRPRLKDVYGDVSIVVCQQVTRLLIALCIGFLLWTFKRALYLKLEADLHYDQLFDRIKQTIIFLNGFIILQRRRTTAQPPPPFLSYDLDALRDLSANGKTYSYQVRRKLRPWCTHLKIRLPFPVPQLAPSPSESECTNIWMDVKRMKRESVPIWILVRLSKEYLNAVKSITPPGAEDLIIDDEKLLQTAEQMFRDITGSPSTQTIDQFGKIKKEDLARGEYELSKDELDYLFKRKLHEEESKSGNGDENQTNIALPRCKAIGVDKFLQWAVRVHKNCWGLKRTLKSSKIAFVKLNRMLSSFLLVVVVIIWLLLSKIVNTGQLALLFAPFLAASFMFENSSKNLFQGIIFAFAMHPFDVGDRVIIENIQMRVKSVHILTSVFYKYDTGAEVIFPNSKLATTKIVNLDITPDQSDSLDFIINSKTPIENIRDLELTIQRLLDDDIYHPSGTKVVKNSCQEAGNPDELKMTVHFKYLVSYLTADKKAARKSDILSKIMRFRKEMESEENMREYPLDFKPYHLEFTINKKVMMLLGIHRIKHQILTRVRNTYAHGKIVLTHVEHKSIKMSLYVCNDEVETTKKQQTETEVKPDENNIKEEPKSYASFFGGFESLLCEYDYKIKLQVRRGDEPEPILYQSPSSPRASWRKTSARINETIAAAARGNGQPSTSTANASTFLSLD